MVSQRVLLMSMLVSLVFSALGPTNLISSTVDLTLPELQHLANHMTNEECHKLVLTLHNDAFRLANDVEDVRGVVPNLNCLKLLLHWNSSPEEGRGKTHEKLSLRLRQIGRTDLSDWLDFAVLNELEEEINNTADEFKKGPEDAESQESSFIQDDLESQFIHDDIDSWEDLVQPAILVVTFIVVGIVFFFAASKLLSRYEKQASSKSKRKRVKKVGGDEYIQLQ